LSKSALKRARKEHQTKGRLEKATASQKECEEMSRSSKAVEYMCSPAGMEAAALISARAQATAFKEMGIFMHTTSSSSARTVDQCVCTNCSFILARDSKFCSDCGTIQNTHAM
jgi:hypothetical protein